MELQGDIPNEQYGQCLPCGSSKKTSKSRGSAKFTSSHSSRTNGEKAVQAGFKVPAQKNSNDLSLELQSRQ